MKVLADLVGIFEDLLLVFTNYSVSDIFIATETDEYHQESEILG